MVMVDRLSGGGVMDVLACLLAWLVGGCHLLIGCGWLVGRLVEWLVC